MNGSETRTEHIDPALKVVGWNVVAGARIPCEYPVTPGLIEGGRRRGRALKLDDVIVYRNHEVAVVVAKAWDEELTEGVAQTKNYVTKGLGTYGIDMQTG
jgi:type I restriction enzyme R subunit